MRGDEARVVDLFCSWLERDGWAVRREVDFCDVVAERGLERLYAEAKGVTASVGLDVDTLYGQLLRRTPVGHGSSATFGVVVPPRLRAAALRVPARTRAALGIVVYIVEDNGTVIMLRPDDEPGAP